MRFFGRAICCWILSGMWCCIQAIPCRGQTTNLFYQQGKACYYESNWAAAITNFSQAITDQYDLWDAYSYRAYARAVIGDSNGALADCRQILKLYPKSSNSYYWSSRINSMLDDYNRAWADFEAGSKMDTHVRPAELAAELATIFENSAHEKFNQGDLAGADADLAAAIRFYSHGNAWHWHASRAWIRVFQNKFDAAIAEANLGIQSAPGEFGLNYQARAWARFGRGDVAGTIEDCNKVLAIWGKSPKPPNTSVLTTEGLLAYINGDYEKAVVCWRKVVDIDYWSKPEQDYLQGWIEKANARLPAAGTNNPAGLTNSPKISGSK